MPDFAFASATAQELDVFCSEEYVELWDTLGVSDPAHSPAMARLRRALHKAKHLTEAADSTPSASSSTPTPSTAQLQPNAWAEHAPPRLDSASIAQLVKDFQQNYPGEHLDGDAMPSVRLLSIVHRWFVPGNAISWVPWQLRLSEKQYQEIIESRTTKTLRTEAAFLSTALFDDTPEMPVDHLRLSPAWLGRIQTVFRNAIALCKGAHLQRLKAYDEKILDLATQAPADPSLHTVSTSELVSADRKLWKEISSLRSSGWNLDDALHEMTTVRSDVGNLLQFRARPPPPPLRPPRDPNAPLRGKGKTGKGKTGKGNAPPLKRKTPDAPGASDTAPLDLVKTHGNKTFCIRFNKGTTVVLSCAAALCRGSSEQGLVLAEIVRQTLAPRADPGTFHEIAPGQPFRLNVLQCLASALQDKDAGLPALLSEGVPTGAFEPLPSSGQWTPAQPELDFSQEFSPASLEHWLAAESNQELLEQLVQEEVSKGFVQPFHGDESAAAQQWPHGTAIGKLNIVMAEGRDPRLVLDSTVCGLNPAVHLPEHVALPTASDVQRSFLAQDCYASLVALSLDFKAAHKCCKVRIFIALKVAGCLATHNYLRYSDTLSWSLRSTSTRWGTKAFERGTALLRKASFSATFAEKEECSFLFAESIEPLRELGCRCQVYAQ
ncbi:hypothetical protein AK812_SmicGene28887 [Symbiodinium microadriaticum]|uniref:Uncharacterized protein n=1 Tax=Symbiodinium microadriaticum TaxID=2951 RepID=A0A1Q9D368_SYMMI|nr:hypothetical protein AK812_SmicGene28887 [Symbiodinium microadriaticum]